METRQLVLIDSDQPTSDEWRLDEQTRQLGLKGVAQARQALKEALGSPNVAAESTAA